MPRIELGVHTEYYDYEVSNNDSSSKDLAVTHMYISRIQCIVGSLYAVYTAAIFGVVERVQNYVRNR